MQRGGEISCIVTGTRRYSSDLEQGGLEIPCTLIFKDEKIHDKKYLNQVHKLVIEVMNPSIKTSDCADSDNIKTQSMAQHNGNSPEPKKRKILNDQNISSSSHIDSWEHEIRNEQMLTNVCVTMAQLRSQFPSINGLYPTMDQYLKQPSHSGSNQLQVFHCRQRHHWIAASSIGCPENVSVFKHL